MRSISAPASAAPAPGAATPEHRFRMSVIVPTYNRRAILLKALEAYQQQTAVRDILEILVIDDGSTDGTPGAVEQFALTAPFPVRYLRQNHEGPARGRNRGIRESRGGLVLFGDDDIIPAPTLVAEHAAWHQKHPGESDAMLGRVDWAPEVHPTPFMEWLSSEGVVFDYGKMRRGLVDENHFYSCNLSIKRNFLLQNGMFDEEFPAAAFEDIELGHRLMAKGLRLFYHPEAVGYHWKRMSLADAVRRAEMVEIASELFRAKVPAPPAPAVRRPGEGARRALRKTLRAVLPAAAPLVRLFDTRVPLPWFVYRIFYAECILPRVQAKVRARAALPRQVPSRTPVGIQP